MSYCNLDPVGIDFQNGFGSEPGTLIRALHAECACDNATCSAAESLTETNTFIANPNDGNGASQNNANHADWYVFTAPEDGLISMYSCNGGVDTRLLLWTGTCDALQSLQISDDDCAEGGGFNYASQICLLYTSPSPRDA